MHQIPIIYKINFLITTGNLVAEAVSINQYQENNRFY
jgi:hypothetical protein